MGDIIPTSPPYCQERRCITLSTQKGLISYNLYMKTSAWIGIVVGSSIGGMIPALWGAGLFSFSGIFFSAVGAFAGIWVAYKMTHL